MRGGQCLSGSPGPGAVRVAVSVVLQCKCGVPPPSWLAGAGLPLHTAASQRFLPREAAQAEIWAGTDEKWGCLVRPSTRSWELDTASSCCLVTLQGERPDPKHGCLLRCLWLTSGSLTGTKIKNNPQFWTVHK